jgi:hypothetical protein
MRILLESYQPFVTFRQQLRSTTSASTAANQTKALLDLDEHRETIKDTLLNLGTYSQALVTEGGGHYKPGDQEFQNPLQSLALAGSDMAAAESLVINQVGPDALVFCARDEVLIPLADAVCRARSGDPDGAVLHAGNAVESYLVAVAGHFSVPLGGAPGINAKLDQLDHAGKLPKKLIFMGKYLGHIRNAADHGIDQDIINASWTISRGTGVEYPFVACSFIAAASSVALQKTPTI